jgi:hypothetical protein
LSKPWAKNARPVRIARSALAPNVPSSDLYVTQGHAVLFDDLLIPAVSLINNATISLYAAEEYRELEFFHIKLEAHDVIFAEGAPCETLLRVDETMNNFAEHFRKHGASETQDVYCAPVVCNGRRSAVMTRARRLVSPWLGPQKFEIIRARLDQRAMDLCEAGQGPVAGLDSSSSCHPGHDLRAQPWQMSFLLLDRIRRALASTSATRWLKPAC